MIVNSHTDVVPPVSLKFHVQDGSDTQGPIIFSFSTTPPQTIIPMFSDVVQMTQRDPSLLRSQLISL